MSRICLNEGWNLLEAPLHYGKEMAGYILSRQDGWYKGINLPADVHMPLIDAGVIKDPVLADYHVDCRWVERRSWWFMKKIQIDTMYPVMELVIESLDVHADIFFNGVYLGHHASAHYPFRQDISEYAAKHNTLLVRLTSGLEHVSDADLSEIDFAVCTEANNGCPERGDMRRAFVRKPTYAYGWDWCPRIGTVAIAKNAYIDCCESAAIRWVTLETVQIGVTARLRAELEIELFDILATADADVTLSISMDGRRAANANATGALLRSGINYLTFDVDVDHARLWWPNGMGSQPLYDVNASVCCRGHQCDYPAFQYGIRKITLDTSKVSALDRKFEIQVNGVPVFCKGANWIPADSIYARVSEDKYEALILEAKEANFNMLRIWGGGLYERDAFYDACDKAGIMVWQDMMFGCATYPDHIDSFYDLVGRELDYQTKRLRNRACIALFCGNNENHWIYVGMKFKREKQYGLKISNTLMPQTMRQNCPWIPYWNSSPYGGDEPNSSHIGDTHHWFECMMNPDMAMRIEPKAYDQVTSRFVTEYGYPGPCALESIQTYFDGRTVERYGKIWNLHNNTFEKLTVDAGIKKHYTDCELSLEDYLLYAGMVQSLMLNYSLESMRFKEFCGGGLFWMFNDCWGEVGWTIIDYYMRRKISFYGVKRAFRPVKLILRDTDDGRAAVVACNDTAEDLTCDLRYGYIGFDGRNDDSQTTHITLPAHSRNPILTFNKGSHDASSGVWYAFPVHPDIQPAILRCPDIRRLKLPPQKASLTMKDKGSDLLITVKAETFCHYVYLNTPPDVRLSDNYFDLLPGESREIIVKGQAGRTYGLMFVDV